MASTSSLFITSRTLADAIFDLLLQLGGHFIAQVAQHLLSGVDSVIGVVARFDQLLALAVFVGVRFGFLAHALDLGYRSDRRRR